MIPFNCQDAEFRVISLLFLSLLNGIDYWLDKVFLARGMNEYSIFFKIQFEH